MYKTFQGMDDLQHMVEQAMGMPMTANCLVPRREVLDILDEMRNAIPIEMDDAQDVLDQRDSILHQAETDANGMVDDAEEQRENILSDAQSRAEAMIADAEAEADRLVSAGRREYEEMTARAAAEAERLVSSGNESYQRSVDEGIAEQQRLVSESEVVRNATAEAQRIVDSAHSDSSRLRSECDRYVDSTLADFEETLSSTLRSVNRDRAALRKGAGATGYRNERDAGRN